MKKILNKLLLYGYSFLCNVKHYKVEKMHMINFVCIYLCILFTLFLVGWLYQWIILGKLELMMLLEGIKPLGGAGFLALMKYITDVTSDTKIMIDKNNNGIPDEEESGDNNVCE